MIRNLGVLCGMLAIVTIAGAQARRHPSTPIRVTEAPEKLVARRIPASSMINHHPVRLATPWSNKISIFRNENNAEVAFRLENPQGDFKNARWQIFADQGYNIKTGTPTLTSFALSGVVQADKNGVSFSIDFGALLHRTAKPFPGSPLTSALVDRLSQDGLLKLYINIQPQHRAATAPIVVEVIPPAVPALATHLEAGVVNGAPGNPPKEWASEAPLWPGTPLRWSTRALGAAKFYAQVSDKPFIDTDVEWAQSGGAIELTDHPKGWQEIKFISAKDLFFSFPKPLITPQIFYVRVLAVDSQGQLAGTPSNAVKLSMPLLGLNDKPGGSKKPNPPAASGVQIQLLSAQFDPENNVIDTTRFVISQDVPKGNSMYAIMKALAGQEPKQGTKLTIVPSTEGKSFLEAAADAVGGALQDAVGYALKLKNFVSDVAGFLSYVFGQIAGLPATISDAAIRYSLSKAGVPDSYLDKFEMARRAPGYVVGFAVSQERKVSNMTAGKAAQLFDQSLYQLSNKSGGMSRLPEVSPFLAQDPDFEYRPARIWIKVRAYASGNTTELFSDTRTIHIICSNDWEDASYQLSNGQVLSGSMTVFDLYATVPPIPVGREIVVPVYMSFPPSNVSNANWGRAWFNPKASHWDIDGRHFDSVTTKPFQRKL